LILSGLFGTTIPIIFEKLKIDPAAASGPFITTLNDLISVTIYFNLAMLLLGLYR
jgi:magnesium transporter